MRTTITAAVLLFTVTLTATPAMAEKPACDPNPLTQGHPGWMKMPSGAVDLGGAAPAAAGNPLMVGFWRSLPVPKAESTGTTTVNPLTNRP